MRASRYFFSILFLFLLLSMASCHKPAPAIYEASSAETEHPSVIDTLALANGHDYVDLGICNGLCWATMNVGATHENEPGTHFFWGDTNADPQAYHDFNFQFYPLGYPLSKYIIIVDEPRDPNKFLDSDGKAALEPSDDAAHVNWGGGWRMPYHEEIDSLLALCSWDKDTLGGVSGYRVTSLREGFTDRSIFLPFTGARIYLTTSRQNQGVYLWSKDVVDWPSDLAWGLVANEEYIARSSYVRYLGQTVRPVFMPGEQLVEKVELDTVHLRMTPGQPDRKLTARIFPSNATRQKVQWLSSNCNIATVDKEGNITALSPGWCYISATATDGTSQSSLCRLEVVDPQPLSHECISLGVANHIRWATCDVGASTPEEAGQLFTLEEARSIRWGDHWRLPTTEELDAMRRQCIWSIITINGVKGFRVSANYTDSNFIFLPTPSVLSPRGYWAATPSHADDGMQSIIAVTADTTFWSFRPDTCRLAVRLVYSLGD